MNISIRHSSNLSDRDTRLIKAQRAALRGDRRQARRLVIPITQPSPHVVDRIVKELGTRKLERQRRAMWRWIALKQFALMLLVVALFVAAVLIGYRLVP